MKKKHISGIVTHWMYSFSIWFEKLSRLLHQRSLRFSDDDFKSCLLCWMVRFFLQNGKWSTIYHELFPCRSFAIALHFPSVFMGVRDWERERHWHFSLFSYSFPVSRLPFRFAFFLLWFHLFFRKSILMATKSTVCPFHCANSLDNSVMWVMARCDTNNENHWKIWIIQWKNLHEIVIKATDTNR